MKTKKEKLKQNNLSRKRKKEKKMSCTSKKLGCKSK